MINWMRTPLDLEKSKLPLRKYTELFDDGWVYKEGLENQVFSRLAERIGRMLKSKQAQSQKPHRRFAFLPSLTT
jgi:hypothetical protein